jgi:hypothetical protein
MAMMNAVRDETCVPRNRYELGRKAVIFVLAALTLSAAQPAQAASLTIDFENEPNLSTQPDNFAMAGAMKTYSKPGVYSISGGVALGNPTFLPAFPANGSPPNLYGTTDVADPSLLSSITLTLPSADEAIGVTLILFNGQPFPEMYEVDAFSAVKVDKRPIATAESFNGGFAVYSVFFGIDFGPITSVVIMPTDADLNGWDFFVDTIGVDVAIIASIPEPGSGLVFLTAILGFLIMVRRRRM